jgi:hypothetical protein
MNTTTAYALRALRQKAQQYLSNDGLEVANLLGSVPTDPWGQQISDEEFCDVCQDYHPTELMAWDTYDYSADRGVYVMCIECAMKMRGLE